jgi:hypothetical protein
MEGVLIYWQYKYFSSSTASTMVSNFIIPNHFLPSNMEHRACDGWLGFNDSRSVIGSSTCLTCDKASIGKALPDAFISAATIYAEPSIAPLAV